MANKTLDPDISKRQDEKFGGDHFSAKEAERHAAEAAGDKPLSPAEQAQLDQIAAGEREHAIKNTYDGSGKKGSGKRNWKTFFKKHGASTGILGILLGVGVGGAGFAGMGMLPIAITENLVGQNDTGATSMERRFMKLFRSISNGDGNALCGSNKVKCKMGKLSNSAINKLAKKGITVKFEGDTTNDGKKTGYPDKKITGYEVDLGDGNGKRFITPSQMPGFLANNKKFAAKILGRQGAFNLRVKMWSGKHITNKLFKKLNIQKKGGIADGKKGDANEKKQASTPDNSKASSVSQDSVKNKVNNMTDKAKKGGLAYMLTVVGCISVKIPGIVAAGVAAVQISQIISVIMNVVLSPSSKAKAAGVGSGFTADDANTIGTLLTEKTKDADGKMTSALDSPYLLAAMGINKGKPPVSTKFAPGFSVLTNPLVKGAREADDAMEPFCSVAMSPVTMYSFMALDVATNFNPIGIIKIVGSFAVGYVIGEIVNRVASDLLASVITEIAQNDDIPKARGKDLGDILGIAAPAFFGSGAAARNIPALTESQVSAWNNVMIENENFHREMDIASLSPFDTSSKYTFLGSITHRLSMAMITSGAYSATGFASAALGVLSSPLSLLSPSVGAATIPEKYCTYAEGWAMDGVDPNSTPAISFAGTPCYGLTSQQLSMDTEYAIDLLESAGWLDTSKDIKDNATIDDLRAAGIIKEDTPITDFIDSCSDVTTGDYVFNSGSCTFNGTAAEVKTSTEVTNIPAGIEGENDDDDIPPIDDYDADALTPYLSASEEQLAAISVFLLDFQILQSMNGEDEVPAGGSSGDYSLPVDPGYSEPDEGQDFGPRECPIVNSDGSCNASTWHAAFDLTGWPDFTMGRPVYAIAAGTVIQSGMGNGCLGGAAGNNTVTIQLENGVKASYMHMSGDDILVNVGDTVKPGQIIGAINTCGQSTGAHLHFFVDVSEAVDPSEFEGLDREPDGGRVDPRGFMALYGLEL